MTGWISIHRRLTEHWIWKDPVKLKWWIDILLTVNHVGAKVNIGLQLYDCKRGQSIMSLSNWAARWGVSKDKARNFLVLLEKDGMITHESLGKTTRITVCNYDSYQCDLHDSQTVSQRLNNDSQTVSHTNNNDNNNNNDNKIINTGETNVSQHATDNLFTEGFKDDSKNGFKESGISIPFEEDKPLESKFEGNNSSVNTEEEKEKSCAKKEKKVAQFKKPTFEQVATYCKERGDLVNPQSWMDFYTSNGWKVGKNPMKDWKAAVRTWERNGVTTYNNKSNGNIWSERRERGYNRKNESGPKETEYKDSF